MAGGGDLDKTALTKCHEEVWDHLRNDLKDIGDDSLLSDQQSLILADIAKMGILNPYCKSIFDQMSVKIHCYGFLASKMASFVKINRFNHAFNEII